MQIYSMAPIVSELPKILLASLEFERFSPISFENIASVFHRKSCKLKCSLANWPNLHSKNLKNEQLEFL